MLRAGYGWFYQRFTVPNSFASAAGTPYIITAIHQNGVNQVEYTVTDPPGYQEISPGVAVKPPTPGSSESALTQYSTAKDMQAAISVDRQIAKAHHRQHHVSLHTRRTSNTSRTISALRLFPPLILAFIQVSPSPQLRKT